MVFHWSVSNSKFHQVFRIFVSNLANFNCAMVWIVWILPLISNSFSLLSKSLETVPRTPITISISFTFLFYSLFNFLARFKYLNNFLPFFFPLWFTTTARSTWWQVLFFLVWFLCLMEPLWVIQHQSHLCRRTVVVLFKLLLGGWEGSYFFQGY